MNAPNVYSQIRCIALRVCKLRMGFSVPSIIWVGVELMQITMQRTRPAWPAKNKIENDRKNDQEQRRNRDDEWNFCWGQEADIALFLQETRIKKIIKSFEGRAITSSEPWNTETNKVDRNTPITSKHAFSKRSAKMNDGTEKPKLPSKFQTAQRDTTNFPIK